MTESLVPPDERQRLAALQALDVLDSPPEAEFDALVRAASLACGVPISMLTLIDAERQWFKASTGLVGISGTAREIAFCDYAIRQDGLFEVADARLDARFADNPMVLGAPGIRFYAGVPLSLSDGVRIGALCVIGTEAQQLTPAQREILLCLGQAATAALQGRRALRDSKVRDDLLRQSGDLLRRTGALVGAGGWELDLSTRQLYWSEEACRLHGMAPDYQPDFEETLRFYAPAVQPMLKAALARSTAEGVGFDLEVPLIRADGKERWVRVFGEVETYGGKPARLAGAFQDITERHQMVAELDEQHELMRVTLQSIGEAVITTDAVGRVDWLNPAAERLTGWTMKTAHGRLLGEVFHLNGEDSREPGVGVLLAEPLAAADSAAAADLASDVAADLDAANGPPRDMLLVGRDGHQWDIENTAAPVRDAMGKLLGTVLVFHDVTEQRRMSGEMSHRATHDALTGLVNRAEFEVRLARTLQRARDDHSTHAMLYIDLDQFKDVNDSCGHAGGDQLLRQVARLLGETVRTRDTLARMGGDEFAIILDHCPAGQAQRIAQEICQRMDQFRFVQQDRRFRIGTSIGLVVIDAGWASTGALLQAADSACYAAKQAGRNQVQAWMDDAARGAARPGEAQWATLIERALDDDGFTLFGQRFDPVVPEGDGVHAEVLLRMRGEDGALLLPGAFMPAAERFKLSSRIDRWVVANAVAWLGGMPGRQPIETLCINLSAQSLVDAQFQGWLIDLLTRLAPALRQSLCFDIHEAVALANLADMAQLIDRLRQVGVRVALDGFGSSGASLDHLKQLRVDYLKIDGAFIQDLIADPLKGVAVRGFCEAANILGLQVVAEYVDKPQVLARLKTLGVDFAQGFLLHLPAPIENLRPMPLRDTPLQ